MLLVFMEILFVFGTLVFRLLRQEWHGGLICAMLVVLAAMVIYREWLIRDWLLFRTRPKKWWLNLWKEWGEPLLIAAVFAFVIRTYILGPYKIPTGSMIPTLMIGDRIFVDKLSYRFQGPERGDIIVFKYPKDEHKDYVKRLVALPGEQIEIREGKVYLNGEPMEDPPFGNYYYYNRDDWTFGRQGQTVVVPEDHYFVLGDNSGQSSDSRNWGFVHENEVVGKAFFIWWPPKRIKLVR